MSGAVNGICQGVRILVGAANVADAAIRAHQADSGEEKVAHGLECALDAIAFLINTTGVVCKASDCSDRTMTILKTSELIAHSFKAGPTILSTIAQWSHGNINALQAIEKGLVAPSLGIIRVATECSMYRYRYLAKLPDKERYIEYQDPDGNTCRDYLTVEECNSREDRAVKALPLANIADVATHAGIGSTALTLSQEVYDGIRASLQAPVQPQAAAAGGAAAGGAAAAAAPVVAPSEDIISLPIAQWASIPDCLHNDPVFSRFTCPITCLPIRDPVIDANGTTLYERSAILSWLRVKPESPMTKRPMYPHQLTDATALKMLIETRLGQYQRAMQNMVAQVSAAPADAQVMQSAEAENPNY